MIAYALHLGRLPPCHPTSSRSLYLDSGWCEVEGADGGEGGGDREDERMAECDAKYTHLSTGGAGSLLGDGPSLRQAQLIGRLDCSCTCRNHLSFAIRKNN